MCLYFPMAHRKLLVVGTIITIAEVYMPHTLLDFESATNTASTVLYSP